MKKSFKIKRLFIPLLMVGVLSFFSFKSTKYFEISKHLEIFNYVYKELQMYYVDDIEPGDLIKKGIDQMLSTLDPYTTYIPETEVEEYSMISNKEYGGIGSLIQKMGKYTVISLPYENLPAAKAGLMAGDTIVSVNEKDVVGKNISDIREMLLGTPDTKITLGIRRYKEKKTLSKEITREHIKIKNVPYYAILKKNKKIGYIKLSGFTQDASEEIRNALDSLKKEGAERLILDLKNNGGGLLNEAVKIVNLFVEKGSLVVSTKGKIKNWSHKYYAEKKPLDTEIPITVLINGNSASASEIVAGALQDLDRAYVIGRNSFGKGLVQQVRSLNYNSKLKVTVAKYYIPSGRCIQKIDYSKKENDIAFDDTDSSKIEKVIYKTLKYGRDVYDGNGLVPDLKIKADYISDIEVALLRKNHFFNFATRYIIDNGLKKHTEFELTDEIYDKFITYLKDKDYDYETVSEKQFKNLKQQLKEEKIFNKLETELKTFEQKLKDTRNRDLEIHKVAIKQQLEMEIIGRLSYRKGQIEKAVNSYDNDVQEAVDILDKYKDFLSGIKSFENKIEAKN